MNDTHRHSSTDAATAKEKDLVCGMSVDPTQARHRTEHKGRTYFFCGAGCRTKFEADPERYLDPERAAAAAKAEAQAAPEGAIYTCPMHPEVRQVAFPVCVAK